MTAPKLTAKIKRRHTKKVKAAGVGGFLSVLLLGIASHVGVHPTGVEASAFTGLVMYGAAWLPEPPRR